MLTAVVSAVLHAVALAAIVVVPLFSDESLPERADAVQAFFATPLELTSAAPPPPPPPASPVAPRAEAPRPAPTARFTAPIEVPSEIVPEGEITLGAEDGVAVGVEGGVPGGVVGGVVGGLPEAPPPPRVEPVRAGGLVKEPRKLKDVPPVYPPIAAQSRLEGVVVLECLIEPSGRVKEARVLRGAPLLEDAALEAVRQWVYTPTLLNGQPVPVILTVTVTFRLR